MFIATPINENVDTYQQKDCDPINEKIDTYQQNFEQPDQYYLVKFPRNNRSEIDCNILRAEYYYYRELHDLGFDTIVVNRMKLIEGRQYPSLWLPRFDTEWQNECFSACANVQPR